MSDYTSTFTENTGDTIDTTDFSTEFNAIQTAIATKYDSDDLLDEDDMSSDSDTQIATQQSIKAYVDNRNLVLGASFSVSSGASVDCSTSIPSWATEVIVVFAGISTDGVAGFSIQIGDSSYKTTGYLATGVKDATTIGSTTTQFPVADANAGAQASSGTAVLRRGYTTNNTWFFESKSSVDSGTQFYTSSGRVTLTSALERVRFNANGDNFDGAGVAGISWRA